jgi:hypothetical protein
MSSVLLLLGLGSALLNVGFQYRWMYIVSAVLLFLWFVQRGIDEPATEGEKMISGCSIIAGVAAVVFTFTQNGGVGEMSFFVVSVLITACLVFTSKGRK